LFDHQFVSLHRAASLTPKTTMKEDPITYLSNTSTARQFHSRTACLLATTALLGIPCIAFAADDEMVDLSTGSEWVTGSSFAEAISADGSVVAGWVRNGGDEQRAFRWDAITGMVNLADTDGSEWVIGSSFVNAISADDGSVLVGWAVAGNGFGSIRRAFRWDAITGMVNLADTDGSSWVIGSSEATSISADGLVVAAMRAAPSAGPRSPAW
jgi:probable HAF family extracellular repeat protein